MQVILLQQVRNLGDIGDEVKVRAGYGRNYLIPQGVALMATKANVAEFEARKAEYLAAAKERKSQAQARAETTARSVTIPMRASDEGKLYGSVGPQEIATALTEEGHDTDAGEVILAEGSIRLTGYYEATLSLHAEVEVDIEVIVAQLTDMGVNMPAKPGSGDASESEAAAAEAAESEEAAVEEPSAEEAGEAEAAAQEAEGEAARASENDETASTQEAQE